MNGGLLGQVDGRAVDGACGQSGGEGLCVRGGMLVGWGIHGVGFMPDDVT